jgi:hypothetical protein
MDIVVGIPKDGNSKLNVVRIDQMGLVLMVLSPVFPWQK